MKKSFTNILLIFLLSVIVIGCSRKKDKFLNKNFHSLTTKYNFLFNGNNLYAEGLSDLENEVKENFWGLLPIEKFKYYDIDDEDRETNFTRSCFLPMAFLSISASPFEKSPIFWDSNITCS